MFPQEVFFPNGEPPQMPEIYSTYKQLEHYQKLWWPGGLADQPHFLMIELDVCRAAEAEFRAVELAKFQQIENMAKQQEK